MIATTKMLAKVTAQIRKDIPRLMELREGCLLMKNEKHDNALKRGEIVKISCVWNAVIQVSPIGEPFSRNYADYQINDLFEIIGHDIMLNDVLEWLQSLDLSMEIQSHNGENTIDLYYISIDKKGDAHEEYATWNLLSPYLKDQSKELIKFLYNSIK